MHMSGQPDNMPRLASRIDYKLVMDCLSQNNVDKAKELCERFGCRPKLGQLLVASGRLSSTELQDLISVHDAEDIKNVPMGKLFVIAGCLSDIELRHYLNLHKQLRLPEEHPERFGQKLVEKGLLSNEQLTVALNDRLQKNITLQEALVLRGYVQSEVLDELA